MLSAVGPKALPYRKQQKPSQGDVEDPEHKGWKKARHRKPVRSNEKQERNSQNHPNHVMTAPAQDDLALVG